MRTILYLVITTVLMSFQGPRYDFEKAWKEVEQFINQGLPQSAINKTNEIYGIARNEKNNPNLVKAITFKASLTQMLKEEENTDHLAFLWEEYEKYPAPVKQLIGLILHSNIKNYYRRHQYKLSDRTFIADATPSNINDWAPRNYELALLDLAEEILSDKEALNINNVRYTEILSKYTPQGLKLRPTLLDVASHYLMQELANPLTSASSFDLGFSINEEGYLSHYEDFIKLNLESSDPLNQAFRTLKIYQNLISFHQSQNNELALLDADMARFSYVLQHSTLDNKYDLLLEVIDEYKPIFRDPFNTARLYHQQASTLYTLSSQDGNAHLRKQAYDICREHVDDTHYGKLMGQMIENITRKQLNTTSNEVFTSAESINVKVTSSNIESLHWRLVELPRNFRDDFRRLYESDFHAYILALDHISTGVHSIDLDPNYFPVESSLNISRQSYGHYAVVVSPSSDFKNIEEGLHMVSFQVSDIAYASKGNDAVNIIVTDRITGAPMNDVKVDIYTSFYDRSTRQNRKQFITSKKTDKNGRLNYSEREGRSISIVLSKGEDYLDVNDNYYIYDYPRNEKSRMEALIFTDRAIYRPGQKLYFKGLLLEKEYNGIPSLGMTMEDVEVVLRDVNYQELSRTKLKSNEFGSVSGSFVLPTSGLTGQHTIELIGKKDLFSSQSILVEEYRRPTFEVVLDQPSGKYNVGDTIEISANAIAYSSAKIDGANVTFRVFRSEVRRWWWYSRIPQGNERVLIHHGATETDENGDFNLSFIARGNNTKTWNYEVEVDVTDISGETQSDQLSMAIGKNALSITLNGNKIRTIEDTSSLTISINNQSGIELNEVLSVKVIELLPEREEIERTDDHNPLRVIRNWKEKATSQWVSFAAEQEKFVNAQALNPGAYKIEMQAGGTTVEDYIIIIDYNNENFVPAADLYLEEAHGSFSPGDEITIRVGSPHSLLYLYQEISRRGDQKEMGWMELNGSSEIKTKVQEDDYGGYFVVLTYFYNNRFRTVTRRINVPWTHKDLDIELVTFRNTLLPGSEEEWHLKIKGKDKDQKAIELLASMYDMSLDQFKYHQWNANLYPSFSIGDIWRGKGFRTASGIHLVNRWNMVSSAYAKSDLRYPYLTILNQWYAGTSKRAGVNVTLRGVSTMSTEAESDAIMSKAEGTLEEVVVQDESATEEEQIVDSGSSLRSDLEETVFFYPHLLTDEEGNIHFQFKMKESLTRWKLMLFAHDQELKYGKLTKEVVTKKDLMVTPFFPRFFRQGDDIVVTSKVNNLSQDTLDVSVKIEVINARTMEPVGSIIQNQNTELNLNIPSGLSRNASWKFSIPGDHLDPILYRVW
ncbi:MAG: hypothetical protein HKN68_21470, partial [Saprospiraceae bacterium]|nr:hypothetical protein [Saprospiraceae bacterium]